MEAVPTKARALRRAISIADDAAVELVVVHVDDEASIPCFSDQVAHETDSFAREFLFRYCDEAPLARLETRVGVPADEILAAAGDVHPAMLAMGWPRSHEPGRGDVVRRVLDRSPVPVLLVAVA